MRPLTWIEALERSVDGKRILEGLVPDARLAIDASQLIQNDTTPHWTLTVFRLYRM